MTFADAVPGALRSYATFSGRARRSEYWWFYLFTLLVGVATSIVDAAIGVVIDNDIGVVGALTSLALLLPTLAVTARRLHDTGRSAWCMLLPVVFLVATCVMAVIAFVSLLFIADGNRTPALALVGGVVACGALTLATGIVLTVFLCLDSSPDDNKYGPSPKPRSALPPGVNGAYPPAWYPPPSGPTQPPSPGPHVW